VAEIGRDLAAQDERDHYHDWLASLPSGTVHPSQVAHRIGWEGGREYERSKRVAEQTVEQSWSAFLAEWKARWVEPSLSPWSAPRASWEFAQAAHRCGWLHRTAESRLTWTRDLPTVPGWYWHRNGPEAPVGMLCLTYWQDQRGVNYLMNDRWGMVSAMQFGAPDSLWCGPLTPPAEPDDGAAREEEETERRNQRIREQVDRENPNLARRWDADEQEDEDPDHG
jgi:hypothetical protein